jgi:hypothetical protein
VEPEDSEERQAENELFEFIQNLNDEEWEDFIKGCETGEIWQDEEKEWIEEE